MCNWLLELCSLDAIIFLALALFNSFHSPAFKTPIRSFFLLFTVRFIFTLFHKDLLVQVFSNGFHSLIFALKNFTICVIPLLTLTAFNPVSTIHSCINSSIVVDLEAVVALHILLIHEVATFAETHSRSTFHFYCFENSCKDLQSLKLSYLRNAFSLVSGRCLYWNQTQRTKLVKTFVRNFGDISDRRSFADACRA